MKARPPTAGHTLHGLVATLLPTYPDLEPEQRRQIEQNVADYVAGQIAAMPTFLRFPYRSALLGFDLLSIPRHGRRFSSLSRAPRESYIASWDTAVLPPMRDFLKLVRSTTLLVFFDHPVVREKLLSTELRDLAGE